MPRFIDVSRDRVSAAEPDQVFDSTAWPRGMHAAIDQLHAGNNHLALPLGSNAQTEAVYRLDEESAPLTASAAYIVCLGEEFPSIWSTIYGPDGTDFEALARRYLGLVEPLIEEAVELSPEDLRILERLGHHLVSAVVTLGDPDRPGSEFDALYVPKAWGYSASSDRDHQEYAVAVAAYTVGIGIVGGLERREF